jgi:hypothetical protein
MSASTASASSGRTHGSHTDGVAALAASIGGGTLPSLVRHEIRALILPLLAPPGEHECRQSTRTTWLCLFLCGGRELATDSRVLRPRVAIAEFGATRARSAGKKCPDTRAQRVSDNNKRDGQAPDITALHGSVRSLQVRARVPPNWAHASATDSAHRCAY